MQQLQSNIIFSKGTILKVCIYRKYIIFLHFPKHKGEH